MAEKTERRTMERCTTVVEAEAYRENDRLLEYCAREEIEEIGASAFHWCPNLQRVVLLRGTRKIGRDCFKNCSSLSELEIHEGIEVIEEGIVQNTNLKIVTLPLHKIPNIHEHAFRTTRSWGGFGASMCSIKALRLRLPFSRKDPLIPCVPRPGNSDIYRPNENDGVYFRRFVKEQQDKFRASEFSHLFHMCFVLKCTQIGLYNLCGDVILARIFRYWFHGPRMPFPIRAVDAFRISCRQNKIGAVEVAVSHSKPQEEDGEEATSKACDEASSSSDGDTENDGEDEDWSDICTRFPNKSGKTFGWACGGTRGVAFSSPFEHKWGHVGRFRRVRHRGPNQGPPPVLHVTTTHHISKMVAFANKSPEELRYEDMMAEQRGFRGSRKTCAKIHRSALYMPQQSNATCWARLWDPKVDFQHISMMPQFATKSPEELRFEALMVIKQTTSNISPFSGGGGDGV